MIPLSREGVHSATRLLSFLGAGGGGRVSEGARIWRYSNSWVPMRGACGKLGCWAQGWRGVVFSPTCPTCSLCPASAERWAATRGAVGGAARLPKAPRPRPWISRPRPGGPGQGLITKCTYLENCESDDNSNS